MMLTSKQKKSKTSRGCKFGQNSSFQPTLNQTQIHVPNIGLLKQTKYAHKQQLGGPRDALLGMSEAVFTVSLSESADIHCSTSTVAYKRSGCICISAA